MSILEKSVVITRVFNNNIVLVKDSGKEKILFEKGIGFGKKFGEKIDKGINIEKIFVIANEENQKNFNEMINRVEDGFFALCEELIVDISKKLGEELSESIHIGLIDHLSFAVKRLKKKEEIQNPFLVEIETLYGLEYDLASQMTSEISKRMNIDIPDGEIGFIALHIHSARTNKKLSNTIKYSYLSNTIIEHVEDSLGVEIDRKCLDYARFITHIRFAIERIQTGNAIKNELIKAIKKQYPISYKIAKEVGEFLESQLDTEVNEDEVAYLAMHIERFKVAIKSK